MQDTLPIVDSTTDGQSCLECAQFVQSGMAMDMGGGRAGYCFRWIARARRVVTVECTQTCNGFRRRSSFFRPLGTSILWSKLPQLLLFNLMGWMRRS